jgi:hypothetical protein
MSLIKITAASMAILGMFAATPAVQAHASLNAGGTGANPAWTNGAIADWLPADATLSSIGYLGIHSLTNARVIQTGLYDSSANATNAALGGSLAGVTSKQGDTLLGQVYNYNSANPGTPLPTDVAISTGANSWAGGVSDANTGLSWGNIHASSGSTGNPELNAMNLLSNAFHYLNVSVGDDLSDIGLGSQQLAFSIYQGWATGPGLQGLNLLTTQLASAAGQDLGVTIALTGNSLNGAGAAGEYTIVVGDQSGVGGKYRLALQASNTAGYSTVVSAVPVPGAVWLFGSALAGLLGYGRRKTAVVAA